MSCAGSNDTYKPKLVLFEKAGGFLSEIGSKL
jgi:hypothetical protein